MLVVTNVSLYNLIILQPDANRLVRTSLDPRWRNSNDTELARVGVVPELKDADVTKAGKTIWYFENIPPVKRCFTHRVRRSVGKCIHNSICQCYVWWIRCLIGGLN